jgi:16S rRNA (guanine527-N7)-methyltransferase
VDYIFKYFPDITDLQKEKFLLLKSMYLQWNNKINLISRKDMENFYLHHVLHSLAVAKVITFTPGTTILDVGTGGGFPGIPLAILFQDSEFTLLDSIEKKIKAVTAIAKEVGLLNVTTARSRVEEHSNNYDFIAGRAVSGFNDFVWKTKDRIKIQGKGTKEKGIIYLKGGDLSEEISQYRDSIKVWEIRDFFDEPYFETKKIIYLQV